MAKKTIMTPELLEITPEDSVSPVYLVPLNDKELEELALADAENEAKALQAEATAAARESALAKLAALGLTPEEIATFN